MMHLTVFALHLPECSKVAKPQPMAGQTLPHSVSDAHWLGLAPWVAVLRALLFVVSVALAACSEPFPKQVPLGDPICLGAACEDCDRIKSKASRELCRQCSGTPCNDRSYAGSWTCDGMVCRDGKTVFHLCIVDDNCLEEEGPHKCCAEFDGGYCPYGGHWCIKK